MLRLNDIVDRVHSTRPAANIEIIHKAYVFTAKVHHGQLRESGEPYLIHPINVSYILADWNLDEETIVTGLLHDTVEDTVATID
ncbi:MAG: bifunctional (p)ppGpp synthetase/guanosine-3',5'-bis(diphosphate) 3'-pyrophosphohydrolase, partial [Deltaproteobacteria bacterium]|nr:bifunctional (p)ppGpp synthetase/guanosine-3',5'-bis(diphosphate) 3'-pyrophosphohydrolase [Deltaproteobacteria bacterium]